MTTTLNKIKSHGPCAEGWATLLAYLGKTEADDEPLSVATILESNGFDHAIWALRAVDGCDREVRLFAADCAERVLPIYEARYPHDNRPRMAIAAARDFANDKIIAAARAAACAAARAAAGAAAWDAAWAAARAAAGAAAWAAAWDAAWAAAENAAWAAGEAARSAAGAAAWAAGAAVWAAAGAAARAAERQWQAERLLYYINGEAK